jgi:hypothetical protein
LLFNPGAAQKGAGIFRKGENDMAVKNDVYEIKVFDDDNNLIKTCHAVDCKLKFGAIRKIMALLKVEDIDNTTELFSAIYGAWEQLTKILSQCFPDMEDSDWDNVDVEDLLPVIYGILKSSFSKILSIPSENSKN